MRFHTKVRTSILLFLLHLTVFTEATAYEFERITVDDGLSQMTVLSICQDSKGLLWFGTRNGLNRYDGYEFKQYFHNPKDPQSINDNYVDNIYEDSQQRLWFTTPLGICQYNWETDDFTRYPLKKRESSATYQDPIRMIFEDKNQNIIICSKNSVYRFYKDEHFFEEIENLPDVGQINFYFESSNGTVFMGTNIGLWIDGEKEEALGTRPIDYMWQTDEDTIWFDTHNFLIRYQPTQRTFKEYDLRTVITEVDWLASRQIFVKNEKELWIGSYRGIAVFDIEKERFVSRIKHDPNNQTSLSDNSVTSMYRDNDNGYWIGTYSGGLNYLRGNRRNFQHYKQIPYSPHTINSNIISSAEETDDGRLLIGTGRGGLNVINRKTGEISQYLTHANIRELHLGANDKLYVGTLQNGLYELDKNFQIIHQYNMQHANLDGNYVFSVLLDSKKNLWVSTANGLNLLRNGSDVFEHLKLEPETQGTEYISEILELPEGELIFTCGKGVFRKKIDGGNFVKEFGYENGNRSGLPHPRIDGMIIDSQKTWWIATKQGLLNYKPQTREFVHYSSHTGFLTNTFYAVLEDDQNNIWTSTNRGIIKLNPTSGDFRHFDLADGIQGLEFRKNAVLKTRRGELLFGGSNGFNLFDPKSVHFNLKPPKLVFTDFYLANQRVLPHEEGSPLKKELIVADEVILNHKQNIFSISYAALNFESPEENQYAYYLDGFESTWNFVGDERTARYTNLKPGKYTFKVKASNNDSVWNAEGISIPITVKPAFWQTFHFQALLVILLILGIALFIRWRLNAMHRQKRMLGRMVREKTTRLREANLNLEEQKKEVERSHEKILQQHDQIQTQLEELEKHRTNLEGLIKERTTQLEKEKIRAEKADALKSSFLANMSHEIRTPLNAIIGFSNIICDEEEVEDVSKAELYEIIKANSDSLLKLIDDILDLSRIESDQMTFNKSNFCLDQLLDELENTFGQNPKVRDGQISLKRYSSKQTIYTDRTRLKQILTNLLSNALKFTEQGEVCFGFEIKDKVIEFEVKDSGIGIPSELQMSIFDRFRKLEDTHNLYRGTGLGLSICQRIVELLGGKIWVESKEGKGSTFAFTIPHGGNIKNTVEESVEKADEIDLSNRHILIAEDDNTNFQFLKFLVEKTGAVVHWAKDGNEAINMYETDPSKANLILMDLKMPNKNGYEALQSIRESNMNTPPIIAQTAHAMDFERKKVADAGFDGYLSKPIDKNLLYGLLKKHLG